MSKATEGFSAAPLSLLSARAEEFGARIERLSETELLATVSLLRADGRTSEYRLSISGGAAQLKVRERQPRRLPADCPERHINHDGTFCTNWVRVEPATVLDNVSAGAFWARLLQYLRQQERAEKMRRWPSKRAWAHGGAAVHQKRAEDCAKGLGADLHKALEHDELSVLPGRGSSGRFLRLICRGKRVYSIWKEEKRLATKRRQCICGRTRLAMCECRDHARLAVNLVFALVEWKRAESQFWAVNKDKACCGTIDGCPRALLAHGAKPDLKSAA